MGTCRLTQKSRLDSTMPASPFDFQDNHGSPYVGFTQKTYIGADTSVPGGSPLFYIRDVLPQIKTHSMAPYDCPLDFIYFIKTFGNLAHSYETL